jgi:hypothetical protein
VKFAVVIYALVLALSASHAARGEARHTELEAKLPTHVTVFCGDDFADWEHVTGTVGLPSSTEGFSYVSKREMHLAPTICRAVAGGPSASIFGHAVHVLYHEWTHSAFQTGDEGLVDCLSLIELRYLLRHYWGLSPKAAQPLYEEAWKVHLRLPPQYQGSCVFEPADPLATF